MSSITKLVWILLSQKNNQKRRDGKSFLTKKFISNNANEH